MDSNKKNVRRAFVEGREDVYVTSAISLFSIAADAKSNHKENEWFSSPEYF